MNCMTRCLTSIHLAAVIGVASSLVAAGAFMPAVAQTSNVKEAEVRPSGGIASVSSSASSRNIYLAGGQVRTASAVEGDLFAAGGRVIVDQSVKGDAALAGGSVDVRAAVGDDLRVAAGSVIIESTVGGELLATAGSITLTPSARVANAASLFAGSVTVDGKIDGPLKVYAQKIVLNGEVKGDAHLAGEQIELGPTAKISGALSYASAAGLKQASGSSIGGATTREERGANRDGDRSAHRHGDRSGHADSDWHMQMQGTGPGWVGWLFGFVALLAFAAVFLLVFPLFAARAADGARALPWLALAMGVGTLVAVPLLAVLLFITLLGIPLGMAVMALYPVLLLAGCVVGVLAIARLAQAALREGTPGSFAATIGFFALALLLVMLVANVPFVGTLASGALVVFGLGGCALELVRRRQANAHSSPTEPRDSAVSSPTASGADRT